MTATLAARRLPLLPLRRSLRWRTRFTCPELLEEERQAAETARALSALSRRSSHAESAAGPGSNFINFCREQNLGPRQRAPLKGERWAAEAALEERLGRKLGHESWVTRGWVMSVPPEPPSTGARQPPPSSGEQRRRALAEWAMGGGGEPSSSSSEAAAASAEPTGPTVRPSEPSAVDSRAERRRALAEFSLTPRQMKAKLDELVIAQDEAKRALSVALCNHYRFVQRCVRSAEVAERHHLKPNVLLLGPSGVGKTHLMRAAAGLLGVPFVRADATRFSATGQPRNPTAPQPHSPGCSLGCSLRKVAHSCLQFLQPCATRYPQAVATPPPPRRQATWAATWRTWCVDCCRRRRATWRWPSTG